MNIQTGETPFWYMILDGWFNEQIVQAASKSWPPFHWPEWFVYNDEGKQVKSVCWKWDLFSMPVRELLGTSMSLPMKTFTGKGDLVPDGTLHGAGMSSMHHGCVLARHLDHDRHPHMGRKREYTTVLFLGDDWKEGYGGELVLGDQNDDVTICPAQNRLVIFRNMDWSFHQVKQLDCPFNYQRKALQVFYYGNFMEESESKRKRAIFL